MARIVVGKSHVYQSKLSSARNVKCGSSQRTITVDDIQIHECRLEMTVDSKHEKIRLVATAVELISIVCGRFYSYAGVLDRITHTDQEKVGEAWGKIVDENYFYTRYILGCTWKIPQIAQDGELHKSTKSAIISA